MSNQLKILIWAINESRTLMEQTCKELLETANLHQIDAMLFGIGHPFKEHKQRIWLLRDYLKSIPENTVVLCMDGADTLFNDTATVLLKKFKKKKTNILISAEKAYTYQYFEFIAPFEDISSPYRYMAAGTLIGYAGYLLKMIEEVILINEEFPNANDQGLFGVWVSRNIHKPSLVQLDTDCSIFWVTTKDWQKLKEVSTTHKTIFNPYTNTLPVIIHNPGNNDPINNACYQAAYQNILRNGN